MGDPFLKFNEGGGEGIYSEPWGVRAFTIIRLERYKLSPKIRAKNVCFEKLLFYQAYAKNVRVPK